MLEPYRVYEAIVREREVKGEEWYVGHVGEVLKEMERNGLFLSRFIEWNIHMVVQTKHFLSLFYHTTHPHLL